MNDDPMRMKKGDPRVALFVSPYYSAFLRT